MFVRRACGGAPVVAVLGTGGPQPATLAEFEAEEGTEIAGGLPAGSTSSWARDCVFAEPATDVVYGDPDAVGTAYLNNHSKGASGVGRTYYAAERFGDSEAHGFVVRENLYTYTASAPDDGGGRTVTDDRRYATLEDALAMARKLALTTPPDGDQFKNTTWTPVSAERAEHEVLRAAEVAAKRAAGRAEYAYQSIGRTPSAYDSDDVVAARNDPAAAARNVADTARLHRAATAAREAALPATRP